ncbi:ornithine monooxygenase [Pseudoalteromonas aurantia]|uniref:Ornithine monooxygenase n=2 Tax=Pseudoalteromonas aurantia TaxID=43654 RepID=A0A5S3V557_9GAMM|nr:ornithine monooxygenase [Pseudoalteromonas aurantia]TMO76562.1 ornithine monooxygenase [Pseudoalteromonas aurantia]
MVTTNSYSSMQMRFDEANMKLYDVIGIGFGPANLALAIALQEQGKLTDKVCFIEKQPNFLWHGGMLLDDTTMQISYLKDLVTQRNPTSHFSFTNFLHHQNRLDSYINLKTFYPSRLEFNSYLSWAASHFNDFCHYAEEVTDIIPIIEQNGVEFLAITTRNSEGHEQTRHAKNIILSPGGNAKIPDVFNDVFQHKNVWHSSQYLMNKDKIKPGEKVAVIGAGQSAAEIFVDVQNIPHQPQVDLVFRAGAMKPADSSPFVNEIFDPRYTDLMYQNTPEQRSAFLTEFRNTNYAVVDEPLLNDIYGRLYTQKLKNETRFSIKNNTHIDAATLSGDKICLTLRYGQHNSQFEKYDHMILATGYHYSSRPPLLESVTQWLENDIARDYQLRTVETFKPKIFTQGINEATHGISDSLLSILAIRSAEIANALELS